MNVTSSFQVTDVTGIMFIVIILLMNNLDSVHGLIVCGECYTFYRMVVYVECALCSLCYYSVDIRSPVRQW